jgi:hypothetical protein
VAEPLTLSVLPERLAVCRLPIEHASEVECPRCGRVMKRRGTRYGPFLGCSGYPECKEFKRLASEVPGWASTSPFLSVTRTADEVSVICAEEGVPKAIQAARGWRALKVQGPFDFEQCGIMARLAVPLAEAAIPILPIGTYNTDYILVREEHLEAALQALERAGHCLST